MRVLVTRPADDAGPTASHLREMGHTPIVAPLLEVRFRDGPELSLENIQAIVATSANGVRALIRRTTRRDLPVFAVGAQTAAMARASGFSGVKNSDGDSIALADAISKWASAQSGPLLHAAGNEATSKLGTRLIEHGFQLRREVLYDVVAVESLPAIAHAALEQGELDAVLLYSPRSAETFARCVEAAGLHNTCRNLIAVCISQAAADKAKGLPFRELRIAARASENELLESLSR
ncbi:MAG TPA: uroporphyrinogen-III synthase [Rhizomicrobium sp.]|jgi:uroporphyrinogen-III synthase